MRIADMNGSVVVQTNKLSSFKNFWNEFALTVLVLEEKYRRCVKASLWRVVMGISGSCTACISPVHVTQKEGGGRAQWLHPRKTTSSHVSSVCSTLPFTAAFHRHFWALAVKIMLSKLFCLCNLGSHLMLGDGLHWTCLQNSYLNFGVHVARSTVLEQTFFLRWCNDAPCSRKGYPSVRGKGTRRSDGVQPDRSSHLRPTKLKGRFAQWITLK